MFEKIEISDRFNEIKKTVEAYIEYMNEEIEIRIESIRIHIDDIFDKLDHDVQIMKHKLIE